MSAPDVYGALVEYVSSKLTADVWLDREPEQTQAGQRVPPYITVEGDIDRTWTFERKYVDQGSVTLHCFGVGNDAANAMGIPAMALFADETTWPSIPISNAKFVEASVSGHGLHPEEEPDRDGQVIYKFDVILNVIVTGAY